MIVCSFTVRLSSVILSSVSKTLIFPFLLLDSGHGGQTKDLDGDEVDGMDEGRDVHNVVLECSLILPVVIFPVDFQQKGHILDDVSVFAISQPLYKFQTTCKY